MTQGVRGLLQKIVMMASERVYYRLELRSQRGRFPAASVSKAMSIVENQG